MKVPDAILKDEALKDAIAVLPVNYNFEVRPCCRSDPSAQLSSFHPSANEETISFYHDLLMSISSNQVHTLVAADPQDSVEDKAGKCSARGAPVSRGPAHVCLHHLRHP